MSLFIFCMLSNSPKYFMFNLLLALSMNPLFFLLCIFLVISIFSFFLLNIGGGVHGNIEKSAQLFQNKTFRILVKQACLTKLHSASVYTPWGYWGKKPDYKKDELQHCLFHQMMYVFNN